MLKNFNFRQIYPQLLSSFEIIKTTPAFIRKHQLWKGFFDYRWLAILSILISVLFTYIVYENLIQNYVEPFQTGLEDSVDAPLESSVADVKSESKRGAITSGTKYLLVILLEMVVFYFSFKTLSKLNVKSTPPTFSEFISAEIRMIKIMIYNFGKGLVVSIVVSIILALLNLDFLSPIIMFFVYAYFMGYAFLDNYNEQFHKRIKESQLIIRRNIGAALAIGVVVSLLIYIPIFGPLFGPIFGAVAAAIYGEKFKIQELAHVA